MTNTERLATEHDVPSGLAMVCGRDGIVKHVLRDDLGLLGDVVGQRMTTIVDRSSAEKAQQFLAEALTMGAAFDWELGVPADHAIRLLHFAASLTEPDGLVVVGAPSRSSVIRFYDELMEVNNEQANALRTALKERALHEREAEVYEQLTRLNSELANMQRELTKKNIELERANQLKNQVLGVAAHDLRNPIGAIRSFSTLLLDSALAIPPEQQRAFLERIKASSDFMLGMIDDVLDITAIESGHLRIDARDLDIAQLVRENLEVNRALANEKRIIIELEVAPELPHVLADASKVEQILNNLLSNAVKFSMPGTVIHVRMRAGDAGVWIDVTDEGPGIAAEELKNLFRPFQRGSQHGTAGERSTGLGLAIVKRLVDGHGGRLECASELGRGTTFSVWLPLVKAA